jgi:hypothetical protein
MTFRIAVPAASVVVVFMPATAASRTTAIVVAHEPALIVSLAFVGVSAHLHAPHRVVRVERWLKQRDTEPHASVLPHKHVMRALVPPEPIKRWNPGTRSLLSDWGRAKRSAAEGERQ